MRFLLVLALALPQRVQTRLVTDEADAVLAILAKRAAQQQVTAADWNRLFTSEGYVRLKKREQSMKRDFDDDAFRKFVLSDELLARRESLASTLEAWRGADLTAAANRALAYLPRNATIRAKVYPVIKPLTNSFVFEVDSDPAIFKYVEAEPRAAFEQTMSHELHHVGFGTACPPPGAAAELGDMRWLGAFGEGFATLAAAGGPQNDPQKNGDRPGLQETWRREMAKYDENFRQLDAFFLDVANGKLKDDAASKRAFDFFGLLGPWYTVGYTMAVTIEQAFGRDAVIDAFCDQRTLLPTYNRAVDKLGAKLPKWDERLANFFSARGTSSATPRARR
jgi:Putative zinc dependent peptidase (DUF5700)